MILRVIRGRADRGTVQALRAALESRLVATPPPGGPDRFHLAVRADASRDAAADPPIDPPELDVLVLACWASAEAAADGDRREISPLSLARRHLGRVDVAHFEVDMNVLREPDVQPIAIRLATGSFLRPGGDIQMQELLRARMPLLGPEMIEAYVGRRLHGRAVDVTFVSAWQAIPAEHDLDAPFWSDISVRYDEFVVEVFRPLD